MFLFSWRSNTTRPPARRTSAARCSSSSQFIKSSLVPASGHYQHQYRHHQGNIKPNATMPMPFSLPGFVTFFFFVLFLPLLHLSSIQVVASPSSSSSSLFSPLSCVPVFFAKAISLRQIHSMDFRLYFTKSGVPTAADCANICGQRHLCQSALFNHDAHSCSLSSSRSIQCDLFKQRFHSFHLTTDGADALSLLACIQQPSCQQQKLDENGADGFSHLLNIDLEPHKTGAMQKGEQEIGQGKHQLDNSPPSSSAKLLLSSLHDKHNNNVAKEEEEANTEDDDDDKNLEERRQQQSEFLAAIRRIHQMQRNLERILRKANGAGRRRGKEGSEEENDAIDDGNGEEEEKKGTNEKNNNKNKKMSIIGLEPANFTTIIGPSSSSSMTLQNGAQLRVHSAGFVARLKPGERIKLMSAGPLLDQQQEQQMEEGDGEENRQLIQLDRKVAIQIPSQLVTMAPELFQQAKRATDNGNNNNNNNNDDGGDISDNEPIVVDGRLVNPEKATAGFLQSLLIHHSSGKHHQRQEEEGGQKHVGQGREEDNTDGEGGGEGGGASLQPSLDATTNLQQQQQQHQQWHPASPALSHHHHSSFSPSNNNNTIVCFRFILHRRLHQLQEGKNAATVAASPIRLLSGLSLNECRCACAETWRAAKVQKGKKAAERWSNKEKEEEEELMGGRPLQQCRSLRYSREEEGGGKGVCELWGTDHNQRLDLVLDIGSDYHYVSCEPKYLLRTADKMCHRHGDKTTLEEHGKIDVENGTVSSINRTWTTTTATAESATTTTTPNGNGTSTLTTTQSPSPPSTTTPLLMALATLNSTKKSAIVGKQSIENQMQMTADDCFERITGFTMRGTAAGLERGVSQTECECLCANSVHSLVNSFQCASASYFPAKRDCVLNLDNRHTAPEQFVDGGQEEGHSAAAALPMNDQEPPPPPPVIYLGLLCLPTSQQLSLLVSACPIPNNNNTKADNNSNLPPTPPPPPTTTTTPLLHHQQQHFPPQLLSSLASSVSSSSILHPSSSSASSSSHSDACFLAQPGFVLQGMALAVETDVNAVQCKCFCALAEQRHQQSCQSAQFYADSRTCLLNRENRATAPDRFTFDGHLDGRNGHTTTYLDFWCGTDEKAIADYLVNKCQKEMSAQSNEERIDSNNGSGDRTALALRMPTTTMMMTTAQFKLLNKGKRKKGKRGEQQQQQQKMLEKTKNDGNEEALNNGTTTTTRSSNSGLPVSTTGVTFSVPAAMSAEEEPELETKRVVAVPSGNGNNNKNNEKNIIGSSSRNKNMGEIPENEEEEQQQQVAGWRTVRVQRGDQMEMGRGGGEGGGQLREQQETERTKMNGGVEEELKTVETKTAASNIQVIEEGTTTESKGTTTAEEGMRANSSSNNGGQPTTTTTTMGTTTGGSGSNGNNNNGSSSRSSISPSTTTTTTTLTTTTGSSTSIETTYPPVGQCRFSALYQTVFNGARLLKRLLVETPAQCLAACHFEQCRSANLIQMEDKQKVCELFRDSIVEFRRNDVLSFDRLAVHFDSVQCKPRSE